jgi:hypothetical protein
MFENRSERELIVIYILIALLFALGAAYFNYITGVGIYYNVFAANVIFFCMFYILYLPLKIKRAREKKEKKEK